MNPPPKKSGNLNLNCLLSSIFDIVDAQKSIVDAEKDTVKIKSTNFENVLDYVQCSKNYKSQ